MICGYHTDCPNPVTRTISTPTGGVPCCDDGWFEWRSLWGTVTRSRERRTYTEPSVEMPSDEDIASLKLSKKEQRELASMSVKERTEVLARLVRTKQRKRRRALDR